MKKDIAVQQLAPQSGEIVLYNPDDTIRLEVRMSEETVWLSQAQMAELLGTQRQAITKHLKNIFESHELDKTATSSILELLQKEGMRMVRRQVELYNLDVIISVGYRVNTQRGIQFRQWALKILKDYLLKGYSVNQRIERLTVSVTPLQDCYLKIFIFENQGIGYLLYPNVNEPSRQFFANQTVAFPQVDEWAITKETEKPRETNQIVFVYTKTDWQFPTTETSRSEIEKWIMKIPADQRYIDIKTIEIRAR